MKLTTLLKTLGFGLLFSFGVSTAHLCAGDDADMDDTPARNEFDSAMPELGAEEDEEKMPEISSEEEMPKKPFEDEGKMPEDSLENSMNDGI